MLVENYYTILSRTENEASTQFRVALNKDCKVYEGHFPNEPISPGVCNIQMIRELAEQIIGHELCLKEVTQCRLTKLITPYLYPEVDVRIELQPTENDTIKIQASIVSDEQQCLTFKGVLE